MADPDLSELAPLLSKVAVEMGREPGAQMLRPEFLGALAARATLAAAAFVGNPLAGHHCASDAQPVCPDLPGHETHSPPCGFTSRPLFQPESVRPGSESVCQCGMSPDPGICPIDHGGALPAGGHCACVHARRPSPTN